MVGRKEGGAGRGAKKKFQFDNGTQLRATETAESWRLEEEEKGSKKGTEWKKKREGGRKSALN